MATVENIKYQINLVSFGIFVIIYILFIFSKCLNITERIKKIG